MTRRLGKTVSQTKPIVRFDDNVQSYDVHRDGRSGEGRTQHVRLDHIEPSPFQVRRVYPEREIEELAESIRAHGLIHEPKGRPHPTKAGWVELMPGEMRVRALRRLVELGEAESVLKRDAEQNWLAPVRIETVDDDRAEAIVLSENLDRTDLSAWEWALAWQQRRESLKARGQAAGVRNVAASLGKKFQTIAEYLRVADAVTHEVLLAAGVVSGGDADHSRMARLSLAALQRVARAADQGVAPAAERLLLELKRVGDTTATDHFEREKAKSRARQLGGSGFQINIRQALSELAPHQATHYLGRIAPAVRVLAVRASEDLGAEEAEALAQVFEGAAARLRRTDR